MKADYTGMTRKFNKHLAEHITAVKLNQCKIAVSKISGTRGYN